MKIAVYTIVLNEEKHIERWFNSCKDADYKIIVDTGSTDKTIEIVKNLGCTVYEINISPWRFDDARNISLSLIPQDVDYCICMDADEVLSEGWRELIELTPEDTTRIRYRYIWSWKDDGSPDVEFWGNKVHSRYGYRWKHPVHEVLSSSIDEKEYYASFQIHHFPDNSKPRNYLDLLIQAVDEDPKDPRNIFYLGREYYFLNIKELAAEKFKTYLSLPTANWASERARAMRYLSNCEIEQKEPWLLKAIAEEPNRRESWADIAFFYYYSKEYIQCLSACERAFSIEQKSLDYLTESFAWDDRLYDIASISAFELGLVNKAIFYCTKAIKLNPEETRYQLNLEHMMTFCK